MKKRKLAIVILILGVLFAPVLSLQKTYAAEASEESQIVSGWQNIDGKEYYLNSKGEKTVGWQKISGKYYYFNKKGVLLKNQIAGSKSTGYWYVDKTGVRITTTEIKYAVKFVMKHSKAGQSKKSRLKSCYKALCKYQYKRIYNDSPSSKKIKSYARYMFKNKKGNCYRYASAFAYIARVLGYDSRVAVGKVSISGKTPVSPHGWCEIKIDGAWKMCDCSIQRGTGKSLFLKTRKKYPYRFVCNDIFTMNVKKGKITWK